MLQPFPLLRVTMTLYAQSRVMACGAGGISRCCATSWSDRHPAALGAVGMSVMADRYPS
jgi:hypothetical protein